MRGSCADNQAAGENREGLATLRIAQSAIRLLYPAACAGEASTQGRYSCSRVKVWALKQSSQLPGFLASEFLPAFPDLRARMFAARSRKLQRNLLHDLEPVSIQADYFSRAVRKEANPSQPKRGENLRADPVVAKTH